MKFHLDTTQKIILLEESVNLGEFYDFIQKLFPESWKSYRLQMKVDVHWKEIPFFPKRAEPLRPYYFNEPVTCLYQNPPSNGKYQIDYNAKSGTITLAEVAGN